jgi:hypothetical protein
LMGVVEKGRIGGVLLRHCQKDWDGRIGRIVDDGGILWVGRSNGGVDD